MATNQGFKSLIPGDELHAMYLFHWLKSKTEYLQSLGNGATFKELSKRTVAQIQIPLPPLHEQRRIAAILDEADGLRAKRRQVFARLDSLTQSIFISMFASETWPTEALADLVQPGTIVTYGIVQAGPEFAGGVPYVRTGDIRDGQIELNALRHTAPNIASKFERSMVHSGDIVMTIRATVGSTAVVPAVLDGANLTQGTARIAPGPLTLGTFLLEYLRSDATQRWIQAQVKGATFKEITLSRLREMRIAVPPVPRQREFVAVATAVDAQRAAALSAAAADNELFASLQARAFRGEL